MLNFETSKLTLGYICRIITDNLSLFICSNLCKEYQRILLIAE